MKREEEEAEEAARRALRAVEDYNKDWKKMDKVYMDKAARQSKKGGRPRSSNMRSLKR